MSDRRKVEFLKEAKNLNYSIYLYYFCTVDPEININRVAIRVKQSGHNVPLEKIKDRYVRSLENLKEAIYISNRAYLFDTSSESYERLLIAEITDGKEVEIFSPEVPAWFIQYVVNKK
jgi:predicted ABC-type ATPase